MKIAELPDELVTLLQAAQETGKHVRSTERVSKGNGLLQGTTLLSVLALAAWSFDLRSELITPSDLELYLGPIREDVAEVKASLSELRSRIPQEVILDRMTSMERRIAALEQR